MEKNTIITDQAGRLLHLGEELVSGGMVRRMERPLGYGMGRLEKGDLYLLVTAEVASQESDGSRKGEAGEGSRSNEVGEGRLSGEAGDGSQSGGNREPGEGCWRIVMGSWAEQEGKSVFQPLVKQAMGEPLLDTVFFGHHVCVHRENREDTRKERGTRLVIEVDDQTVIFGTEDTCAEGIGTEETCAENADAGNSCAMVAFNRSGIKYFRTESLGTDGVSLEAVLEGTPYSGFWDSERMIEEGYMAEQVLRPEVWHLLESMDAMDGKEEPSRPMGEIDGRKIIAEGLSIGGNMPGENMPEGDRTGKGGIGGDRPGVNMPEENRLGGNRTGGLKIYRIQSEGDLLDEIRIRLWEYSAMKQAEKDRFMAQYAFSLRGGDEKIQRVRYLLQKAAPTNTTILLTGESGTGKTYLAREIHKHSKRIEKPFLQVNCAAIPTELMESEFFGYEEGAFTGARKGGKAGYFEMAEGGTLFLDEITEMPLSLQGKLLEVLQNRTYFRIGGEKKKVADVRLIAATNKNLDRLVEGHAFREDLFYRINVFSVEIPPLRQRLDSLFSMATDLLPDICHRLDVGQQILSMEALEKMTAYSWPGNIRQLENVLEKACILSDGKVILPEDIELEGDKEKKAGGEEGVGGTLKAQREDFEKKIIRETLAACQGSRIKTARILGIGKTSLFEKMRKYGIEIGGREDADLDDDFNY